MKQTNCSSPPHSRKRFLIPLALLTFFLPFNLLASHSKNPGHLPVFYPASKPIDKATKTDTYRDWIFDKTVGNVEFYHKIDICNGSGVVFLKFKNKNEYEVKITWKELFTTQMENNTEGFRGTKELTISKGVTMPANCEDVANKKIIIPASDVNPVYLADIQKFEYKDITVSRVQ